MIKVSKAVTESRQISERLTKLQNEMMLSAVTGNYNDFKVAKKQYANVAHENYNLAFATQKPKPIQVPLFSKIGMRMLKVHFLDIFRIKTPAEKALKKLSKIENAKRKFNLNI